MYLTTIEKEKCTKIILIPAKTKVIIRIKFYKYYLIIYLSDKYHKSCEAFANCICVHIKISKKEVRVKFVFGDSLLATRGDMVKTKHVCIYYYKIIIISLSLADVNMSLSRAQNACRCPTKTVIIIIIMIIIGTTAFTAVTSLHTNNHKLESPKNKNLSTSLTRLVHFCCTLSAD